MTFDNELILLQETVYQDEIGNERTTITELPVLCSVDSVTRSEFYSAANNGLKPELVFIVKNYEYTGEQNVIYKGEKYRVIRTYPVEFEELELTCEKVIGNG